MPEPEVDRSGRYIGIANISVYWPDWGGWGSTCEAEISLEVGLDSGEPVEGWTECWMADAGVWIGIALTGDLDGPDSAKGAAEIEINYDADSVEWTGDFATVNSLDGGLGGSASVFSNEMVYEVDFSVNR